MPALEQLPDNRPVVECASLPLGLGFHRKISNVPGAVEQHFRRVLGICCAEEGGNWIRSSSRREMERMMAAQIVEL
jgi:hypothetical protein